ncbi:hypothetical protein M378DRAFT_165773 [Amanita muscaria Koide BX008]|uniref:Uncharacterized protein n=1 Tax=Amanita muscaria (strain Koide BX008) TaxID=946122 RepID=A0A0C2WLE5_AMAMK|nr:hypothetical protein M378DRAFT_165773 [Amanita muscaria Koide BX008]
MDEILKDAINPFTADTHSHSLVTSKVGLMHNAQVSPISYLDFFFGTTRATIHVYSH